MYTLYVTLSQAKGVSQTMKGLLNHNLKVSSPPEWHTVYRYTSLLISISTATGGTPTTEPTLVPPAGMIKTLY